MGLLLSAAPGFQSHLFTRLGELRDVKSLLLSLIEYLRTSDSEGLDTYKIENTK